MVYDNANGDLSPQEAKSYAGRGEGPIFPFSMRLIRSAEELFANRTDLARLPGVYWLSEKSRTGTFLAAEFPDPTDEAIGVLREFFSDHGFEVVEFDERASDYD